MSINMPNLKRVNYTVVEIFNTGNTVTLKSGLGVTQAPWEWHHSVDRIRRVTMALPGPTLYHFLDKTRYWSKIAIFHTIPAFDDTGSWCPRRNIAIRFGTEY